MKNRAKIIAFYLPQYHPTKDNDEWWGKGFTEWTNVGKAKPLFRGHYQPKIPADLGYYDLRLPEVREAQAELAKKAGIYGFCYYHYWFGNGKQELEMPFNEVLATGKPDFPFMLCWANESWHKKFWDKDGNSSSKKILVEQTYPNEEDYISHFYHLLPAFKDQRHIKIDNKPTFMIYRPFEFQDVAKFIKIWNELAIKEGLDGIYFMCQINDNFNDETINKLESLGFNAINSMRLFEARKCSLSWGRRAFEKLMATLFKRPHIHNYNRIKKYFVSQMEKRSNVYPTIIPNWDHSPRSNTSAIILTASTPKAFKIHVKEVLELTKSKSENIIFLKSWNEWGEGNYMEPDLKYKHGYINALRESLEE